jgi:hypothetical protein
VTGRWSHRLVRPGEYVLHCDDVEVGMITFVPGVECQALRLDQVVAAMSAIDEQLADPALPPKGDDFRELGWTGRAAHDTRRNRARAEARGHPVEVQVWLRRQWDDRGWRWPLSPEQMGEWETLVRTAGERFAQDRDAEQSAIDCALAPADEWIVDPPTPLDDPEVAA